MLLLNQFCPAKKPLESCAGFLQCRVCQWRTPHEQQAVPRGQCGEDGVHRFPQQSLGSIPVNGIAHG
jgi:hypothetical protein